MSNKKIGIITINDYENLGNRLQNYASQTILNNYGHVETIDSNLHYVHSKSLLHYFKYIGLMKTKKILHYHYENLHMKKIGKIVLKNLIKI